MDIDERERSLEPQEPSGEEKERAARSGTHQYIKELLFDYIRGRVLWPKEDRVRDQLETHEERMKRFRSEGASGVTTTTRIAEDGESVYAVWKRLLTLTVCADLSPLLRWLFCQRVANTVPVQPTLQSHCLSLDSQRKTIANE